MMKLKRNQKGFTLIEVLLIVVILGIIAAIAIPRLMASRQEAQEKACHSNVANINTALEKYYFDSGIDPTATTFPDIIGIGGISVTLPNGTTQTVIYMPDGTPVCQAGGAYSLTTTLRGTCSVHGNINGGT